LTLIGLGLCDYNDISLRGLEALKQADVVYFENFTNILACSIKEMEKAYGRMITPVKREFLEPGEGLIAEAQSRRVALLVIGDPLTATTHISLFLRAKEKGVAVEVIHNASVMSAVAITGLQPYKFGMTSSLPFPGSSFKPETAYEVIKRNKASGMHTLLLLDLKPDEGRFMGIGEAIDILLSIEEKRLDGVFATNTPCIGCARLGWPDCRIICGKASELRKADFGKPPHCLVVPGSLHFVEEEAIGGYRLNHS
ncbi:diphthine synthase, partial [Candidatus Woesearchaeota archaeon CG10_big_fil_rev_8_21_14_0_10_47_5]